MPRNLVVLGSTGSIGRQTLDVARQFREEIRVYGLAADRSVQQLLTQVQAFRPVAISVGSDYPGDGLGTEVLRGEQGMVELVSRPEVDLVVVGTAGRAGLLPTLAALDHGKLVALANKETLIMAGPIIRECLRSGTGRLVPIDSEHSAIWQCLQGEADASVERLTLTASGGALRHLTLDELDHVTPEQALRHPTWEMGPKITVDSANLMNKGLEVIEAHWLFDVDLEKIDVVMHPQSIVHSLVTFDDGSTKAQLGLPDMRLPIQYALSHPRRWPNAMSRLNLAETRDLTFGPVDLQRYPALSIALDAGRQGGTAPAVLSAADEVAVQAFLTGQIQFTAISRLVSEVLDRLEPCGNPTLDDILKHDTWARQEASTLVAQLSLTAS